MWLPDRGTAEYASWRIARILSLRHEHIRVGWRPGPEGVDYDPMTIRGRGTAGDFEILINRTGTIRVHVTASGTDEDGDDPVRETLMLGWDDIIRREMESGPLETGFKQAVLSIERAAGLVGPPWDELPPLSGDGATHTAASVFATTVLAVLTSVHTALERPVSTWAISVPIDREEDEDWYETRWLAERFPGLLDDVRSRSAGPADERQVWILSVRREGFDDLVIDPSGPRAWVEGLDHPLDLLTLGARDDAPGADPVRTAMRLLGPRSELVGVPPGTKLTYGVVESHDGSEDSFATLGGRIERSDATRDGSAEGSGPWSVVVRPLLGPAREFRSSRAPRAGREPGSVLFSRDDVDMLHRPVRPSDSGWVSKYDIGLDDHDLHKLLDVIGKLSEDIDTTDPDCWAELARQRAAVEQLVALSLPGRETVFSLHYLLLDENRVVNPLFRAERGWDSDLPPSDLRWEEAAFHLACAQGNLRSMDEFDASEDPFALLGAADHHTIHPTMSRAFLDVFDRGHRVPVELARLAEGAADDPVDGALFPVVTSSSMSLMFRGTSRRIELFEALGEALRTHEKEPSAR